MRKAVLDPSMSSSSITDQSPQSGTSTREEDQKIAFLGEENGSSCHDISLAVILNGVQKEPELIFEDRQQPSLTEKRCAD